MERMLNFSNQSTKPNAIGLLWKKKMELLLFVKCSKRPPKYKVSEVCNMDTGHCRHSHYSSALFFSEVALFNFTQLDLNTIDSATKWPSAAIRCPWKKSPKGI